MPKTIMVCGHGPGISNAVAAKFGAQGFSVAIVGRNRERLALAADLSKGIALALTQWLDSEEAEQLNHIARQALEGVCAGRAGASVARREVFAIQRGRSTFHLSYEDAI